jgi:hypothetical protein
MGLANTLGWTGVDNFISPRRNTLTALGASLLSGKPGVGVSEGIQADTALAVHQKAEADRASQINQTAQWARSQFPELADAPDEIVAQMAPKLWENQLTGGGSNLPANIQEWEYFSKLSPEQQNQYLVMKRSVPYLDTGADFVRPDAVTGQTAGAPTIAKDNFGAAYDTASGTAQGKVDVEVGAEASSLASKLPGLKTVVGELSQLAEKATYTQTGQVIDNAMREAGLEPTEAAVARTKYIAMVDNQVLPLLRDTFGAAFTVKEGETLRATLGDPNKGPTEKQAILEAFIEQKVRDLAALQSRVPAASGGANADPLGIR